MFWTTFVQAPLMVLKAVCPLSGARLNVGLWPGDVRWSSWSDWPPWCRVRHLIRFHGVLAPHARLRAQIVPREPINAHDPAHTAHGATPSRMSWARLPHASKLARSRPAALTGAGTAAVPGGLIATPDWRDSWFSPAMENMKRK